MNIRKVLIAEATGYLAGYVGGRLCKQYELTLTNRIELGAADPVLSV
ncbi:MAG TPA: hypothetical protein VNJ09_06620 [Chthonomonadales bacterium]|nr:hypothetical protein [Chthonomonadales bacterium]